MHLMTKFRPKKCKWSCCEYHWQNLFCSKLPQKLQTFWQRICLENNTRFYVSSKNRCFIWYMQIGVIKKEMNEKYKLLWFYKIYAFLDTLYENGIGEEVSIWWGEQEKNWYISFLKNGKRNIFSNIWIYEWCTLSTVKML